VDPLGDPLAQKLQTVGSIGRQNVPSIMDAPAYYRCNAPPAAWCHRSVRTPYSTVLYQRHNTAPNVTVGTTPRQRGHRGCFPLGITRRAAPHLGGPPLRGSSPVSRPFQNRWPRNQGVPLGDHPPPTWWHRVFSVGDHPKGGSPSRRTPAFEVPPQ
jgi:hypothetical protein